MKYFNSENAAGNISAAFFAISLSNVDFRYLTWLERVIKEVNAMIDKVSSKI